MSAHVLEGPLGYTDPPRSLEKRAHSVSPAAGAGRSRDAAGRPVERAVAASLSWGLLLLLLLLLLYSKDSEITREATCLLLGPASCPGLGFRHLAAGEVLWVPESSELESRW